MALIEVRDVTKVFGRNPRRVLPLIEAGRTKEEILAETGHALALRKVTLDVQAGEIFVIMGLSGSGKSTLVRHLNRLIDPTAGQILYNGIDIIGFSRRQLKAFRRAHTSMVFQRFGLFPHRTVAENVAYALKLRGVARRARTEKAQAWIEAVGLQGYADAYPSQLSGGMQQRVGLARALCAEAQVMLMDEAFSALDPLIRSEMQDQLIALQSRLARTIVFITHDLDEALRLGDRIAILKDGEVAQIGTPAEILLTPADDYVRAFVKHVNRARALSVDVIMRPAALRLTDENMAQALSAMRRAGEAHGYVVADETYRGVVSREAVEEEARRTPAANVARLAENRHSVDPAAPIEAAVPAALEADYPIPVLRAGTELVGVVERADMIQVLEGSGPAGAPQAGPEEQPAGPRASDETDKARKR
jgi:glycine betaine/proline transport system ATP-binding protein